MRATLSGADLADAVQIAARIVPTRPAGPVRAVTLEVEDESTVRVVASDMASIFSTTLQTEEPAEKGRVVISAKVLQDVLRVLPKDSVSVAQTEANKVTIRSTRVDFNLRALPAEEFPVPELALDDGARTCVELDGKDFARGLAQVLPAAATEETRPVFTGCLVEVEGDEVRLAATDSYRLAERVLRGDVEGENTRAVIPARVLEEMRKLPSMAEGMRIRMTLGPDSAVVEVGVTRVKCRYVEGMFPDYRNLIPSGHPYRMQASKQELVEAVRRVAVIAREFTPVRLVLDGGVVVEVVDQEIGEAKEIIQSGTYEGKEMEIAFNSRYLSDAAAGCEGEECELHFKDPLSAALVTEVGGGDYKHIVMPVRL